jgi:surfeit locus 1 family protein
VKRFPIGLTLITALALAVLIGLGVWQLQRLKWKEALLGKIAALEHAAPRRLETVLAAAPITGAEYARVTVRCAPAAGPSPRLFRYSLRDGQIGWRLLTECRLGEGPFDAILLDRGLVSRFAGAMAPGAADFPAPVLVTGVLRAPGAASLFDPAAPSIVGDVTSLRVIDEAALAAAARQSGLAHPAPYILAVESETPAPAGIEPAALPEAIANNHLVYAFTWFGLAGALIGVYVAMVAARLRGQ